MSDLAPGILIAVPQMDDPNFARSVVLLIEHNESGAMGITFNRPSDVALVDSTTMGLALVYNGLPLKPGQGIESVVMNGPTFTTYKPTGVDHPYLMFLVREHDGRFAPVGGQIDPDISIQKIDRL